MEMLTEFFPVLDGFEWDDGNSLKSVRKHSVTQAESEQLFFNRPVVVTDSSVHSGEKRHFALGKTDSARLLAVVFTIRNNRVRIISARPMSRKERGVYGKA